jgi:hypothetical protein
VLLDEKGCFSTGCSGDSINITPVKEIAGNAENYFEIFPNPSNGSFTHTTGHFCFTQRRHARNALIIKGNRYQSLRTLRRCVENVQ